MNIKKCKLIGVGLTSLLIGSYAIPQVFAQDAAINEPVVVDEPGVAPSHIDDEYSEQGHPELKPPTVKDIRAFLTENAAYILPEFDKVIKGNDEEHIGWMVKDITRIMYEHKALVKFDPKVALLFIDVLKLENDLHHSIEEKLEAGEKPEVAGNAVKDQLRALIAKRIELEKGQVAFKKSLLDTQLKELEESSQKVDEITEKELKAIILELKQAHEEGGEDQGK